MLRYLGYGQKDFSEDPILVMNRFNWEFYACMRGRMRPTGLQGGGEVFCAEPRLWVFPPHHPHGWESRGKVDRAVFHFTSVPEVIRESCAKDGYFSLPLERTDVEMIRRLGKSLEPCFRAPSPAALLLFERALIDLSLLLLRGRDFGATLPLETVAIERAERTTEWYISHLHERPTLKRLADVMHLSVAHLRRQFRLVYGKSPHAVLMQLRLEKAAQYLANTGDTLDVIARRSGFNSASDLCRVFKKRLKVYPNEWRTQVAGREKPEHQVRRLVARVDPLAAAQTDRELDAEIERRKRTRSGGISRPKRTVAGSPRRGRGGAVTGRTASVRA